MIGAGFLTFYTKIRIWILIGSKAKAKAISKSESTMGANPSGKPVGRELPPFCSNPLPTNHYQTLSALSIIKLAHLPRRTP